MDWRERAWDVAIFLVTSGVLGLLFRPAIDQAIASSIRRTSEKLKTLINELYAKELAERAMTATMTEENHDALEFMRASVIQQGKELPKVSESVSKMTDAVDRLTKVVAKIEESHQSLLIASARIEERQSQFERQRREDFDRLAIEGKTPRRASDTI